MSVYKSAKTTGYNTILTKKNLVLPYNTGAINNLQRCIQFTSRLAGQSTQEPQLKWFEVSACTIQLGAMTVLVAKDMVELLVLLIIVKFIWSHA